MLSPLFLLLCVTPALAFVSSPTNRFEVDGKINMLKMLGRDSMPDEIMEVIDSLTDTDKDEIVTVYNKLRTAAASDLPKDADEGVEYMKKYAPNLYPKVQKALDSMKTKFKAMKSGTKSALLKMLNDLFSASELSPEKREFWVNYFQSQLPQKYEQLSSTVRDDVKKNMPKIDKFLTSWQFKLEAEAARGRAFMGAAPLKYDALKAFHDQCNFPTC